MRDHSVERMKNLQYEFLKFKNPNNAEYGSPEFYDDFLWHWMTRITLLTKFKEGSLSKSDFPDTWEKLCESVKRMAEKGHFIEVKKDYIYYTFKPLPWQRKKK